MYDAFTLYFFLKGFNNNHNNNNNNIYDFIFIS